MESRRIAGAACIAAAVLIFVLASSAFGCLPQEGDCSTSALLVSMNMLEHDSGPNALRLQVTVRTLQSDLIQFADGTPNLSWLNRERALERAAASGAKAVQVARGMRLPAFSTMPDSDLARLETDLITSDSPANLIQVNRLKSITAELARRQQAIVLLRERRLAAIKVVKPASARIAPARVAPAPVPAAPAPVIPGSNDPYNAPAPSGQPVYIAGNTSVWYNVNDGHRRLTMFIDANHQTGLTMAVWGPAQDVWGEKPVGMGARGEGHDFFWTGRSGMKGIWRVKLTNHNDFGVPYTFVGMSVSDKAGDMCRNCHGNIEDEWDRCEHSGSFCEDLKDDIKK